MLATRTIGTLSRIAVLASLVAVCSVAPAPSSDLSLHVDPMIVEFSSPSDGEQKASVSIANYGNEPERVVALGVDWHTAFDGAVTIERVGAERDRSLTPYLSVSPSSFVLQPGEARDVSLAMRQPAAAPGVAARWGGFVIRATALSDAEPAMSPGATVFVYETVGNPHRHVTLTALSLRPDRARVPELTARLANDGETYVRPICHLVIERGETVVRDIAIPTNVIFPGDKRALRAPLEPLPSGDYHVQLTVDYGGGAIIDGAVDARIP